MVILAIGHLSTWSIGGGPNSQHISEELKKFLEYRFKIKEKWVKCYMKTIFMCGMCTSSRIESKHRVYKNFLNGDSRLCEIFKVFQELEEKQSLSYQDEFKKLSKTQQNELSEHILVQEVEKYFSPYAVRKIKEIILKSTNYAIQEVKAGQKW